MRRLERGMAAWKVGVLSLLLAILIVVAAFYKQNPFADPFEVRAAFGVPRRAGWGCAPCRRDARYRRPPTPAAGPAHTADHLLIEFRLH